MNKKVILVLILIAFLTSEVVNASEVYLDYSKNGKIDVYQKPNNCNQWNEYELRYFNTTATSSSGSQSVYRMNRLCDVHFEGDNPTTGITKRVLLTNPGNWEKAVKVQTNNGNIFLGGVHGYEEQTSLKFYANREEITPEIGSMIKADIVHIIVTSNLIDPDDKNVILATVKTVYCWNGDVLSITNTYSWKRDVTVVTAYAAMFPVNDDPNISSIGTLFGQESQDLYSGNSPIYAKTNGAQLHNKKNSLVMSMEVLQPEISLSNYDHFKNLGTFIKCNSDYNKLYVPFIIGSNLNVGKGTKWSFTAIYRVWNYGFKK